MFNYVLIKHKQTSFVSNGGKFKLYTVLNGLIFPTPTQPRISFERSIPPTLYFSARMHKVLKLTVKDTRSTYLVEPRLESLCKYSSKLETEVDSKSATAPSPKKYSLLALLLETLASEEDGKSFCCLAMI
jgi:hypothetical protein